MKYPFLYSIRMHLVLLILILVIPALGLILYSGLNRQKYEIEKARTNALSVVHDIAFQQEQIVESARVLLMILAELPEVQNKNADKCDRLFDALLKERQLYADIFAITKEGMIFSSALPFKPQTVKHRKFYQNVIATKDFSIGEFGIGGISRLPVLSFAYPVFNAKGKMQAIVAATLNLARYSKVFPLSRLPEDSELVLTDQNNIIIYHFPGSREDLGRHDVPDLIKNMQSQRDEGAFIARDNDGIKHLYAYKKLRLKGRETPYLNIRVSINEKTALADARQILLRNMMYVSTVSIIALLFFWFIGGVLITKKVGKLADAAKRLGLGDIKARTGLNHEGGELSQLAKAFDEMAEELEDRGKKLRLSEEKYRNIFENSVEGIFQTTPEGHFISANPALARMFGFQSPQDFIKNIRDIENQLYVNPDDRKTLKRLCDKQDVVSNFEARQYSRDGSIFWISLNARAVRDKDGKIICYEGTIKDITDRKSAEESLQAEKEKLFTILENDPTGIALIDMNGVYQYVNPEFTNITGYTLEEVPTGRLWFRKAYPDHEYRRQVVAPWKQSKQLNTGTGKGIKQEFTIYCKDGQSKYIEFITTFQKEYSISVFMDATKRRQAEKEIQELNHELEQHIEELKAINEGLEAFGFSLSHDLRTPLVSIGGFSRRLLEKYAGCLDEKGRQYLNIIKTNTIRMEELISDLLTFFKLGGGTVQYSNVKMDVIVQETFNQIKMLYRDRTIELSTRTIPDVKGDGIMLKQVFANLMTNAVKYGKPDDITIIEVAGWVENEENIYYVKDNGLGFSMDYADKVFEIFERLRTAEGIEGTGIGLAIVKRIVKQHGGRVWVEAKVNEGAAFYFTIPR